jgi:resuscitation-promoting factor RpfB
MVIGLATIRDVNQSKDTPIPYATVYQFDSNQADGTALVTQPGTDGYVQHEFTVKQITGQEVARRETTETTVQSTDEVVTIRDVRSSDAGARSRGCLRRADTSGQCVATYSVWATYYTAASAGGSTTATGSGVYKGIIAVDPRVIPLGTRMYVPGYGYGIAADTGGGVKGYLIDLAYGASDNYDWYATT